MKIVKQIPCKYCGKLFNEQKWRNRKFCSKDCFQLYRMTKISKIEFEKKIRCRKCRREIPERIPEQNGMCFKCWWEIKIPH